MDLLKHQEELLFTLRMAATRNQSNEIVYKTEWLGYLPYGLYHWIEVNGETVKTNNPDSLQKDLFVLEKLGLITKVKEVKSEGEEWDVYIYYELSIK